MSAPMLSPLIWSVFPAIDFESIKTLFTPTQRDTQGPDAGNERVETSRRRRSSMHLPKKRNSLDRERQQNEGTEAVISLRKLTCEEESEQ